MTGRQILDAIYILKASRSVLAKHVGLRRRQLDIYGKTSSLVKAVNAQTSRFPFIARAVSNLADRVKSSGGSDPSSPTGPQFTAQDNPQSTSSEHIDGKDISFSETKTDREQIHFDTHPGADPAAEHLPGEESGTRIDHAKRFPVSGSSVSSAKDEKPLPSRGRDTFSDRSLTESQKNPLVDAAEKTDETLQPSSTNRTSIPTPWTHGSSMNSESARKLQRLAEKQVPSISAEPHPPTETQTTSSNDKSEDLDMDRQQDVFFTRPVHTGSVLSSLPRFKLPKITTNTQDEIEHLSETDINQDVFYSAKPAGSSVPDNQQALPDQEEPSEAIYSELFHSPRAARLLKREDQKEESRNLRVEKIELPHKVDEEYVSSVPSSSAKTADLLEEKKAEDTRQLAADIVNDTTSTPSKATEVSFELHFI